MNKNLLLPILCTMLCVGSMHSKGQDAEKTVTLASFETGVTQDNPCKLGVAVTNQSLDTIANDQTDGINPSGKCLKVTMKAGTGWYGITVTFTPTTPITVTDDNRYLHVFMRRSDARIPVQMYPNAASSKSYYQAQCPGGENNKIWYDVVIDLKTVTAGTAPATISSLIFRPSNQACAAGDTYYFDDMILSNSADKREKLDVVIPDKPEKLIVSFEDGEKPIYPCTLGKAIANQSLDTIANDQTDGVNTSEKCLKMSMKVGAGWWILTTSVVFAPATINITDENRYLHFFMRRSDTKNSLLIYPNNSQNVHYKATFEGGASNQTWQDVVIDLKTPFAGAAPTGIFILTIRPNNGLTCAAGDAFYFDEFMLSNSATPRGETSENLAVNKNENSLVYTNQNKELVIQSNEEIESVELFTTSGQLILNRNSSLSAHSVIPVQSLVSGIYFVKIKTQSGSEVHKIRVE